MKKILITGANSYIGMAFEKWISKWPDNFKADTIDMIDGSWVNKDFSAYDTIFHVAGIAHIKETKKNAGLYFDINRDLAFNVAQKAKSSGVKQFVFLSSMSVYGLDSGNISRDTVPRPVSNYGKSKLQAEEQIIKLTDKDFVVTILRPPMVYGKGCKGNYQKLSKYSKSFPVFPDIQNKRSMIYIDNLSAFVTKVITECSPGLFCPQNCEYVCTSEMVRLIAELDGRKIRLTKIFNPIIKILRIGIITRIFGSLTYDCSFDCIGDVKFKESVAKTEGKSYEQ